MEDVGEGEAKERQAWLVCQQPSPEEGNYSENRVSSLICCLYQLKCRVGSIQRLRSVTWHMGKVQMMTPDYIQVTGATEVPAISQSQAAHSLGNQKLSSWRGNRKLLSCVF